MEEPTAEECTVAFVDLAGFSALTEAHGDEEAVDLVDRFLELSRTALADEGRLVKSIGDAVMLAFPDPAAGVGAVARLFEACYAEAGFPIPRAGLHHGPVVERAGDVFGGTVNLAARVATQARGGQVLSTALVAHAARRLGLPVVGLGSFGLHNLAREVDLFEVAVSRLAEDTVVDPVCRMQVSRARAAGRLRYDDRDWWFCSLRCAAMFAAAPAEHTPDA